MKTGDFAVYTLIFHQFSQLLLAIGAGGHQNLTTGFPYLVGFDLAADRSAVRTNLIDRNRAAAAAATDGVFTVRGEFDIVLAECLEKVARLFDDPALASDITGIVVGDFLGDHIRIKLQPTLFPYPVGVLHDVDDRQSFVSAAVDRQKLLGAARGMATFTNEHFLAFQPARLVIDFLDYPFQDAITVEQTVVDAVEIPRTGRPGVTGSSEYSGDPHQRLGLHQKITDSREEHEFRTFHIQWEGDIHALFFPHVLAEKLQGINERWNGNSRSVARGAFQLLAGTHHQGSRGDTYLAKNISPQMGDQPVVDARRTLMIAAATGCTIVKAIRHLLDLLIC